MQTVLQEVEAIVKSQPLPYVYSAKFETCITPKCLLFDQNHLLPNHLVLNFIHRKYRSNHFYRSFLRTSSERNI